MNRRVLRYSSVAICLLWLSSLHSLSGRTLTSFETVTEHVQVFHDVVNVGVLRRNGKVLLIDSGEGHVLQAAKRAGVTTIDWVLYTHYHRDQCSSAGLLKKAGVKIAVPAAETKFFRDATQFWLEADKVIDHRYDFRPRLFVLRSSVAPDRELRPGDVFRWEGLDIEVIPTPGHTDGSVSYVVDIDGQKIAFTGDLIYGPGQLWEFYSLQSPFPGMTGFKNAGHGGYWAFGGAVSQLKKSLDLVLDRRPTILVPSHGTIMRDPAEAIELLKKNVDAAMVNYLRLAAWRIYFKDRVKPGYSAPMFQPLPTPKLPAWIHRGVQTSWYIRADDGSIFLFDCGFSPVVNELDHLVDSGSIKGVDGIWISHYHDDHVQSVNEVRRRFGAKVYAQKEVQDILENPRAYLMPCLFPESIRVDHPISEGEVINWKGYKLTGYYFPGQTLYHDGLLIEHDGTRVFMSGDSISNFGIDDYCIDNRNFVGEKEPGYQQCLKLLLKLKPDLLVAAHFGPVPFSESYLADALTLLEERKLLFAKLFPWEDPNFGLDPRWVRAFPYRQAVLKGQVVTLEARIYNHADSPSEASVELRAPSGWKVEKSQPVLMPPHTEGKIRLSAVAPVDPPLRREVLGLAVHFRGRNLGEMTEAIVDYMQ